MVPISRDLCNADASYDLASTVSNTKAEGNLKRAKGVRSAMNASHTLVPEASGLRPMPLSQSP